MSTVPGQPSVLQVPWLPDERFELGFDSRQGLVTHPDGRGQRLTVTSHRAIQLGQGQGKRTTSLVALDQLSGVEIVDVWRPTGRLAQSLLLLSVGILLGLLVWTVLGPWLLVLVASGLPTLVGIYLLAGYLFPDEHGELVLHAHGYAVRVPLLEERAKRDAYHVAHRVFELMAARQRATPTSSPRQVPDPSGTVVAPSSDQDGDLPLADERPHTEEATPHEVPPLQEGRAQELT